MNNSEKKNNGDSKKIYSLLVLIAVVMIATTGGTYAYFAIKPQTNTAISGTAASASMTLGVKRITPSDTKWNGSTKKMVPQLEGTTNGSILKSAMGDTYSCVDSNSNVVCQVYEITVTNGGTAQTKVTGKINFTLSGAMANLKRKIYYSGTTKLTTATAATKLATQAATQITSGSDITLTTTDDQKTLKATGVSGSVQYYYIVVWIDETNEVQTDTGTFTGTVTFQTPDGKGITSTFIS